MYLFICWCIQFPYFLYPHLIHSLIQLTKITFIVCWTQWSHRWTSATRSLPLRSLQSSLLYPYVFQSQPKMSVSSVSVASWWFWEGHRAPHHLASPRWSLCVSGWKHWLQETCSLGSLAFACCQMPSSYWSSYTKGTVAAQGRVPGVLFPEEDFWQLQMLVSMAVEASSLNAA